MKLSLDVLRERAEAVASEELLKSINGGMQEDCHLCDIQAMKPNNIH
jgi:hypothetical protein